MNHVSLISGHNLLWMQPPRVLVPLRMVKGPVWRNSFWVSQWHSFPVTVMNEGSSPPTVCCPFWSYGLCRERTLKLVNLEALRTSMGSRCVLVAGVATSKKASGLPLSYAHFELCSFWGPPLNGSYRSCTPSVLTTTCKQSEGEEEQIPENRVSGLGDFRTALGGGCFMIFSGRI